MKTIDWTRCKFEISYKTLNITYISLRIFVLNVCAELLKFVNKPCLLKTCMENIEVVIVVSSFQQYNNFKQVLFCFLIYSTSLKCLLMKAIADKLCKFNFVFTLLCLNTFYIM